MSPYIIAMAIVAALVISAVLTGRFRRPGSVAYVLDHPNERSLHERPVPRGGGLAILLAIIICGAALGFYRPVSGLTGAGVAALIVAIVSFLDDRRSVTPAGRLAAHAVAAAVIVYSGFYPQRLDIPGLSWDWPPAAAMVLSALFIVWMINLYNFMDGMDGFAGGMTVFGFGAFAVLGWMAGQDMFLALSAIVAAAAAGFLFFNFPPAQIFMGDIGSSTLGLLAAAFSLWGARDGVFPFWIAILVFSPFIVDATVTLIRRLLRRERIWQAHKTHFYQRLVRAGWSHRRTVLLEYVIMFGCAGSAVWGMRAPVGIQIGIVAGWAAIYLGFFFRVSRLPVPDDKTETP